ncbi:MAG TPA: metallophosphoesterase [Geomonas sp.]|nr:metallophosphoesterase [Geomonas sp.]
MKLLVISDSHGNYPHAFKAHQLAGPVDHIIHLGDGADDARLMEEVLEVPVHRVAGNCDYEPQLPRELTIDFGDCRVLITHGNRHSVKAGLANLIDRGMEVGASLILYGHTHLPAVDSAEGMLLVNPGALKEGLSASYAIVTVDGTEVHAELHGFDPAKGAR